MSGTKLMQQVARTLGCARSKACPTPKLCGDNGVCSEAWRDQVPTVTTCGRCPGWRHVGASGEGHRAFAEHQAAEHPARTGKRKRTVVNYGR